MIVGVPLSGCLCAHGFPAGGGGPAAVWRGLTELQSASRRGESTRMTAKAAWSDPMDTTGLVRPSRRSGGLRVSVSAVTDWLWIIFFVGVASPAYAIGIENSERYFWIVADLAVVLFALKNAELLFSFAKRYALLMTWCVLAILSALWSIAPGVSIYHGLQLLMTVMVGAMLCLTKPLERILRILFVALLISLLASLVLLAVKPALAFDHNGAFRGILNHKNEFGSRMALLLLTATMLFLHGWRRLTTLAAICVAVIMLGLSRSGTSLLLTVAWVAPLLLAISHQAGYRALSATLGLAVIFLAVGVALVIAKDIDLLSEVLGSVGKELTLTGRTVLWSIGADAFMDKPILGYGYKGYWENPGILGRLPAYCDWPGSLVLPQQLPRGCGCVRLHGACAPDRHAAGWPVLRDVALSGGPKLHHVVVGDVHLLRHRIWSG